MSRSLYVGLIVVLVQLLPAVAGQTCSQFSQSNSVCWGNTANNQGTRKPSWLKCTWVYGSNQCVDQCTSITALSNCTSSRKCKQSSATYWDSSAQKFVTNTKCFYDCEKYSGYSSNICPSGCNYNSQTRKCYTSCTSYNGKSSSGCPSSDCNRYSSGAATEGEAHNNVYCAPGQCAKTTGYSSCIRFSGCTYVANKCRINCGSLGTYYYNACVDIPDCKQMTDDQATYSCSDSEGGEGQLAERALQEQRVCTRKHYVRKSCERTCDSYISAYDCYRYRYHQCGWNPVTEKCEQRCDMRDPTTCTSDGQCIKLQGKDRYGNEKCAPNCARATDSSTCSYMSCQWMYGSNTCGQNCNFYKYNYTDYTSYDFNISCALQKECQQDETTCATRCAGFESPTQCTDRYQCKWDLSKSANEETSCADNCNARYSARSCTKPGGGSSCEWENINKCSHKCDPTEASAPCFLNRFNEHDCQKANGVCQRKCGELNIKSCNASYAPHCQLDIWGRNCVPKCSTLSRVDCFVQNDECIWTGSTCSPQCMNITDAGSCGATGVCKWYAHTTRDGVETKYGGLCFSDCSKFTTMSTCGRAPGCAYNQFSDSPSKCQPIGDCSKLTSDWINSENNKACDALPWCQWSSSYRKCRTKCSALTQDQCGEPLWCFWNTTIPAQSEGGEGGKVILQEEQLFDRAMSTQRTAAACEPHCFAFESGRSGVEDSKPLHCNWYRGFAAGQTECKYLHTEAICTGGFNDCVWAGGKCEKPCMQRTSNDCEDWDQCEYYDPVTPTPAPTAGGGEEFARSVEAQQAAAASNDDNYRRSKRCYPKQTCATQTTETGCLSISPFKCFWSEGKCINTCQHGSSCQWFDNQGDQCVNMSTTYLSYMTIGYYNGCMPKCENYGAATCARLGTHGCTMRNDGCKLACNYFWGKCPPGCAPDADGICAEAANPKKMVRSKMKMEGAFTQAMLVGALRKRLIRALRTDLSTYLGVHYDAVIIIALRLGSLEVDFEVMDVNNDASGIVGKVTELPSEPVGTFSETKKVYTDEGGDATTFTGVSSASAEEVEIDQGGLSAGAIAGIVIGCLVFVGILGAAAFFAMGGKKNGGKSTAPMPADDKAQPMLPMSSSAPQPAAAPGASLQSQPIGQPQGTLAPLGSAGAPAAYQQAPAAPARPHNDLDDDDADML